MIEKDIKKFLHASDPVRNVVGNRIYAGKAGQNISGAMLIVRNVTSDRFNSLTNEVDCKRSLLQVDCYDESATKAYDLGELVRNRLSGYQGTAGDATVQGAIIISERAGTEAPANKSDRWIHVYSFDFSIIHDQAVPTWA